MRKFSSNYKLFICSTKDGIRGNVTDIMPNSCTYMGEEKLPLEDFPVSVLRGKVTSWIRQSSESESAKV
jgi:hypothetical protein